MTDCSSLLCAVFEAFKASSLRTRLPAVDIKTLKEPKIFSVEEAFVSYAGWNPVEIKDQGRFEEDLVEKVEPAIKDQTLVILRDFPSWAASLSRINESNRKVCERFELYLAGMELANGFSELVDSLEQKRRFIEENRKRRAAGLEPIKIPGKFLSALDRCPPSAGIAMGVDRLLMFLLGADHIEQVIAPFSPD